MINTQQEYGEELDEVREPYNMISASSGILDTRRQIRRLSNKNSTHLTGYVPTY